MDDIKTKERYDFSTRSFALGLIAGILISALLTSFMSIITDPTKPKITRNDRLPNVGAEKVSKISGIHKHNKNPHNLNLKKFDCIQISQWYENNQINPNLIELGNVVLEFNRKNETVIIGNLLGLNYEKQGDTINFNHAANPLDKVQYRDSFKFNTRTALLTQEISFLGKGGQYFPAYKGKYRCEKLFTLP